tara:strand:- start:3163 stop:3795 length:633 start_codon:yes stop_codon:yes gene_type:complete
MKLKEIDLSSKTLEEYQKVMIKDNVKEIDLLKFFLNMSTIELNKLPQKHVDIYTMQINSILNRDHELVTRFKLDGVEYGFIPKLDDITYGENLDVTKHIGEYGSMHKAMAVLYRPIKQKLGDKYLIEDYENSYKYSEQLKKMPLNVVLGSIVFFYNLTSELLNFTLNYLENQEEMEDSGLKQTLQENGVDLLNSIHSLKETLRDLNPSLS